MRAALASNVHSQCTTLAVGWPVLPAWRAAEGSQRPRSAESAQRFERDQLLDGLPAPDQTRLAIFDQHLRSQRPTVVVR